ncbi:TRAP transporter large permease subunit [Gelria sp. Kuro-4]|uniref:TRAP transporter large permease subunit n=1 Tax=Gelria sp. Kuro-4 TaxID=2796927 RepID=UPI001BEF835B|nr:TRAP transporter large permease subunit [Gelria sp. Kuro-4]BCV23923.1 C4-dicarboxylate ABC transporter permease [Gelria sp. Kuro-4]
MSVELLAFLLMLAVFIGSSFWAKLPIGLAMVAAAIAGTLVSGFGVPVRHLVEGMFGYLDTVLVIATAMVFMKVVQECGALQFITQSVFVHAYKHPTILLVFLMLVSMFPGMITGSSTASVLTTGAIVAPILLSMGFPKVDAAAFIAMAALFGMIAPPVNLPAMIIGAGVDMPYMGFTKPLLLLTMPLAVFTALYLGLRFVNSERMREVALSLRNEQGATGVRSILPLGALLLLMLVPKWMPHLVPDPGLPLTFLLASLSGFLAQPRLNFTKVALIAVHDALPVMGILMGVGMFIQAMTLTGVRGLIVVGVLGLPSLLLYLGIALAMPAFGAVSSFGSASVLGVPFLLALLSQNQVITGSALSLIASLGDLVPPTALAGIFAAQVLEMDNYFPVLRKCIVPSVAIVLVGLAAILGANALAAWML